MKLTILLWLIMRNIYLMYKNSSCRTVAQLMPDNEYLHPHLNLIEFQYTGLTESGGQSGAPIFNSKGRLIGMHRSQIGGLVYGVPLPALKAVIDDIETGSKHYLLKKKRKKKKHRSH
ncbi:hypothetical protein Leryth_006045 [Lithospermum erythrorhizon]|nr:hypothetical protein Leryth_006045 [Lithospermum erythrorhizon]